MATQKILIIDDDLVLLETLVDILVAKGYQCMACHDSDISPSEIASFQPDFILLDYHLPSVNGGVLCAEIRKEPSLSLIPIVIMSAYSNLLLSVKEYGCNAILEKPFQLAELEHVINQHLHQSKKGDSFLTKIRKAFRQK